MYNPNYCERAIPLVAVNDKTGKYQMTDDALKFLRSVPAPLGIVSVAGLYRTGKSYLLNRMLLNTNKPKQGFGVGPTINPCTKGLWCWGTPIKGKSNNGESINIIVIDTEGIGALDEDQTHDTRIFTLAILASSCFIYNSVGSIDETAVQNLSLVVNLTKHIQLKSTNKSYDDDQNADQMAHYFPTFYWVVRDFSLQLQDIQGNAITSKDYLQKALAPLKSSSQFDQDVEQKNKIRKLLTSFFKDRDCFTMVRPLVDQTKLQDLDSIPFEDLRPDFIEQVIQFRKRVTQGLKIKTVNGKQLNGEMYCNMMSSYVGAINDGAVPNIENAWNYMCQEQCQKLQDQCQNLFDKELRDNIKFPVDEQYFESTCQNGLELCMINYREKAIGDLQLSLKYEKELKERIKEKIKMAKDENAKVSKELLQKKVLQVFNPIMEQLKKQQFKTFDEFEKTISSTYENLVANSPNLPFSRQKYLQLYKKVQRQGAEYIFKCLNKQIQNSKAMFAEKEQFYKKQIDTIKNDQDNDRRSFSSKLSDMDKEKFETQSKIQRLEFELDRLTKQKESEAQKLSKNLSTKHSQFESSRKSLQTKLQEYEEKYDELNRNLSKQQKVWQKDRALMQSKIKQLSTTIQELEKQKIILTSKYEETNNQTTLSYKESLTKAEKKIVEMQNQVKKLKDVKFQLTEGLKTAKDELEERNDKFQRSEKKLKQELNLKRRQIETMKNDFQMEKKKLEQELEDEREKTNKTKSTLTQDFKNQKTTIAQLTEELRKTRADFDTREAELQQKMKFSEDEKRFLRDQLEQVKRNHVRVIEELRTQNNQVTEEREKVRIQEVRTQYITQIKSINIQYENEKKKFIYETETLKNSFKDMQLELRVTKQQLQEEKNHFKQYEEETTDKIQSLMQQLKNLERAKESTLMEKQTLLKKKIFDLEAQIEYIKQKNDTEHRETQQKNKQCIIQLRITYERQREEMETNYLRQKERSKRKYDQTVEQYEEKLRQQTETHEEQLQNLRDECSMIVEDQRTQISQLKYSIDFKQKENESLKQLLSETKATLAKKEEQFTKKWDSMLITFKMQKDQLTNKLQTLQQQFNQLEKDFMNVNHEKQRLSNEHEKIKTAFKQLQDQYKIKLDELNAQIDQLKKRLQQKEKELTVLKINLERQTALYIQEKQHMALKCNQLEFEMKKINEINEEKLRRQKAEFDSAYVKAVQSLTTEKNTLQQKYEKIKKTSKDIESSLNKKITEMEKQKAVETERIANLEAKLIQLENKRKYEVSNLEKNLQMIKSTYSAEKSELISENSKLRTELDEMSKKRLDIETKYDKDTLLLKNAIQNQINIRETKETALNEHIRQLELRIQNLQKTSTSEATKAQSTYNEQRVRIEQTYRTKITQNNKLIEKLTRDSDELQRRYDYETKDLREQLAVEKQARETLQGRFDKKTSEWQQIERKLMAELDVLKTQREKNGLQFHKELEKEKQNLKLKLNDIENKLKNVEKEKNQMFMENERERARISSQLTNMNQELQELKDAKTKLQKEKAKLDRQNERLKAEKKSTKTASFIRFDKSGLDERKSQITYTRKQKVTEKKESYEYKNEEDQNKENLLNISQQILLD